MKIGSSEIITGLFAISVIALGAVLVIWTGSVSAESRVGAVAYFDDVNLLEDSARVAVNGYEVGRVTGMTTVNLDRDGKGRKILIRVDFELNEDLIDDLGTKATAKIGQESLLGKKFLQVIPSPAGGKLEKEDGRYLFEAEPYFDMFKTLEDLNKKVDPLLESATNIMHILETKTLPSINAGLLSEKNLANFTAILEESKKLMAEANAQVAKLDQRFYGPDGESGLFGGVEALMSDSKDLIAQLSGAITDLQGSATRTMENADDLMAGLNETQLQLAKRVNDETLPRLNELLDDSKTTVNRIGDDINGVTESAKDTLEGVDTLVGDPHLLALARDLRGLIREMKLLTLSLREDPSQVLFGGPGRIEEAEPAPRDETERRLSGRGRRYEP